MESNLPAHDDQLHDSASHVRLRNDKQRWSALSLVGIQECNGLRGPDAIIELRNCTCGTTLGRLTRRTALTFEVYCDDAGEFRWRLPAFNGQMAAASGEGYPRREDAHHAIAALLNGINAAVIVDA